MPISTYKLPSVSPPPPPPKKNKKKQQCHDLLSRTITGFYIYVKVHLANINNHKKVSGHMISNYVSAIRAKFVLYDLKYKLLESPKIKYSITSLLINRSLAIVKQNSKDINNLKALVYACDTKYMVECSKQFS